MKDIFKIVSVLIGSLIGAGFASGQEMNIFFYSYGIKGMIGVIIANTLIGLVIYKTFILIKEENITNYKEFLDGLLSNNKRSIKIEKYKYLNIKHIMNITINIFILITYFIMIAGFGAYLEQEFELSSIIGSIILSIFTFIIAFCNKDKFLKINEILIPILIILVVIIGIEGTKSLNIYDTILKINENIKSGFIKSAILYASYNSILLIPILITLNKELKTKKQILKISSITTIILIILSYIIFILLSKIDINISTIEMPMVYVTTSISNIFKYIYGFIILTAIFTTTISLQKSFLENCAKNKKSYPQIVLLMCITGVLTSNIGFSNLVNSLYIVFGYLGLIQIVRLITKKIKDKDKV